MDIHNMVSRYQIHGWSTNMVIPYGVVRMRVLYSTQVPIPCMGIGMCVDTYTEKEKARSTVQYVRKTRVDVCTHAMRGQEYEYMMQAGVALQTSYSSMHTYRQIGEHKYRDNATKHTNISTLSGSEWDGYGCSVHHVLWCIVVYITTSSSTRYACQQVHEHMH